jgi:methionyl-tRNA formyltransferase
LKPKTPRDPKFQGELRRLAPDCVPTVAYGALLPGEVLEIPRLGWVNLHFSLLPAWRGAAPVQHAILAGDQVTGATAFVIEEALDSGPVLGAMTYQIPARATSGDVLATLAASANRLLVDALDAMEDGTARPQPQAREGISLAPRLTTPDGRIDWTAPAWAIDRRIRACTPAPGAWTTFRAERLGLGVLNSFAASEPEADAGAIVAGKRSVWVGSGTQAVELGRVRPAGKGWMDAADWARGARPEQGELLGDDA